MEAPRVSPGFLGGDKVERYPDLAAVSRVPKSLGLIQAGHGLWKCPDCGTYYGFEVFDRGWPKGSCQTYLWRLTPAEAMETYRSPREGTPEHEELRRYEERLPEWMRDTQACLSHSDSAVRERAAQALASHFRARSEWTGVEALLGYADASIRRGALLAFDDSRFVSFRQGREDIVPTLLKALIDRDASVARQAFVLLDQYYDKEKRKQILDHVNAIPAARRAAGVRMLVLAYSYSLEALVAGLADPEKEVREVALSKAFEWSLGDSAFVERLRAKLRDIAEAYRTPQMDRYLSVENPDGDED
jgi:hypothetical protein